MDVDTLPNHINMCLDFLSLSFFDFILFIIVVYGNNTKTIIYKKNMLKDVAKGPGESRVPNLPISYSIKN
jgi:hypothetical protein